jgi:hypothetical protein
MKKLTLLLALLAFTGCDSLGPAFGDADLQDNKGVSEPNITADAIFTVSSPEETVVTYRTTPRNNQGSCNTTNGVWTNNGGQTSGPNHNQCTDITTVPGASVEVTFSEVVNYVLPRSGNINLNFAPVLEEDGSLSPRGVHYRKNGNWTEGFGVIIGLGDDGSEWAIDLGQIGHSGDEQLKARSIGPLTATKVGAQGVEPGAVTLAW